MDGGDSFIFDDITNCLQTLRLGASNTAETAPAVTYLALASKEDVYTREHLGDSAILRTLSEVIDCNLNDSLETVDLALRCIGNACIDNDAARRQVTALGFAWASRALGLLARNDFSTPALTAQVLYNVCSDFEPAQQGCLREHVHYDLIHLLASTTSVGSGYNILFIELLFWVCSHKTPDSTTQDPLPEKVLTDLLKLPSMHQTILDEEDFAIVLETVLLFLRDNETQRSVVERKQVELAWNMLKLNEGKLSHLDRDEEDAKLLAPLSASLTWCLSDMAARPEFVTKYNLTDDWIQTEILHKILTANSAANVRLLNAACQVLANMLCSLNDPETCSALIESRMPRRLLDTLVQSHDAELLHSACGLLIQLSRHSAQVRVKISTEDQAREALERLCRHETPALKQDGIKLLRALGKECPTVQERFADLAKEVMLAPPNGDAAMIEAPA